MMGFGAPQIDVLQPSVTARLGGLRGRCVADWNSIEVRV
jgi:hypothetical protein